MKNRIGAMAVISVIACVSAPAASAKSSAVLHSPSQVKAGQRFTVSTTGGSDSPGGVTYRLCVDKQTAPGHWQPQACTPIAAHHVGTTQTSQLAPSRPGTPPVFQCSLSRIGWKTPRPRARDQREGHYKAMA